MKSLQVQDALDILKPDQVLKVGGAGHKVLLLMEGQAGAYVFPSPGVVPIFLHHNPVFTSQAVRSGTLALQRRSCTPWVAS